VVVLELEEEIPVFADEVGCTIMHETMIKKHWKAVVTAKEIKCEGDSMRLVPGFHTVALDFGEYLTNKVRIKVEK